MSLFQNVFDDVLKFSVVAGFIIIVIAGLAKKPPREILEWLKEFLTVEKEQE